MQEPGIRETGGTDLFEITTKQRESKQGLAFAEAEVGRHQSTCVASTTPYIVRVEDRAS